MKLRFTLFSELAFLAASISAGLFVSRTAAGALYQQVPQLLDRPLALALAGSLACAMWLLCRFAARKVGSETVAERALPAIVLGAVFWRPFPDTLWSLSVFGAALAPAAFRLLPRFGSTAVGCHAPRVLAIVGAAASFIVYLRTLAPSVVEGDSSEFQTAAYTLGIAHPTGYPLYLLLGKLFTFLPFGNVAYRVNLLSAVCAALAVYVVILICAKLIDARFAVVGGLTLAFTSVFWSQAVIAEVYALNALIVALMLYFVVRTVHGARDQRQPSSLLMWLVFGFGLAHHRTVLLLAPALVACTLVSRRRWRALTLHLLGGASLAALPLVLYAYLPLRWAAEYGREIDWPAFQWHVLASGYQFALRIDSLFDQPGRYAYVLSLLQNQLSWPAVLLGVIGLLALLRARVGLAVLLLLSFAAFALFPVAYHVPDVAVFSIPALMVFVVYLAYGTNLAATVLGRLISGAGLASLGLSVSLAALLPAYLFVTSFVANDMSGQTGLDAWGKLALAQPVPSGSLVVSDMPRNSALRYFFGVEAPNRRLRTAMPDAEVEARSIVSATIASGNPVYLARFVPGLAGYALDAPGPLVSVRKEGPKSKAPIAAPLAPGIGLAGSTTWPPVVSAGETWPLLLRWHNDRKLSDNHYVHLRLLDGDSKLAYSSKPGVPVQGMYPTYLWPESSLVNDYRELAIPQSLLPGTYSIQVGLGGPFRQPQQWAAVGAIHVTPGAVDPSKGGTLAVFDGGVALVGADFAERVAAGGVVRPLLKWTRLDRSSDVRATAEVELRAASRVRSSRAPLLESYRSWAQALELRLDKELRPGTYRLIVRLTTEDGRLLSASSGWAAEKTTEVDVGEIAVTTPLQEAFTNLENEVILVRRELERETLKPGEKVRLVLHWQAVARMTVDYTVFVHLLDISGKVRAQVDSFPLAGLRPTSQWRPGDEIADPYELALPADLTAGTYEIEVGMYRAANMQRLQVVDKDQQPVDDRVLVGPVRILTQ